MKAALAMLAASATAAAFIAYVGAIAWSGVAQVAALIAGK